MTAIELINEIEKKAKVKLSTRDRNWIKDNVIRRNLHISSKVNFIIDWNEIYVYHTIIQNGKIRTAQKVDRFKFAIVISDAGCCRILLPT